MLARLEVVSEPLFEKASDCYFAFLLCNFPNLKGMVARYGEQLLKSPSLIFNQGPSYRWKEQSERT